MSLFLFFKCRLRRRNKSTRLFFTLDPVAALAHNRTDRHRRFKEENKVLIIIMMMIINDVRTTINIFLVKKQQQNTKKKCKRREHSGCFCTSSSFLKKLKTMKQKEMFWTWFLNDWSGFSMLWRRWRVGGCLA